MAELLAAQVDRGTSAHRSLSINTISQSGFTEIFIKIIRDLPKKHIFNPVFFIELFMSENLKKLLDNSGVILGKILEYSCRDQDVESACLSSVIKGSPTLINSLGAQKMPYKYVEFSTQLPSFAVFSCAEIFRFIDSRIEGSISLAPAIGKF